VSRSLAFGFCYIYYDSVRFFFKAKFMIRPRPLVLTVLDGFGHRSIKDHNAIESANAPYWQSLLSNYPNNLLSASGLDVGLPAGQMGNSEVGHLTMGAGRVLYQDLTRIHHAVADGSFFKNSILKAALQQAKINGSQLHILGLLSPGGIHSHENHIFALLKLIGDMDLPQVYLHAFLDGRDTPPKSALASLERLHTHASNAKAQIASISGRFYAMDRDQRWERTEACYRALTEGQGLSAGSFAEALEAAYQRGETDEFVTPTCIQNTEQPLVMIQDNDVVIYMNFRADRARQLSFALTSPSFSGFQRRQTPKLLGFYSLTDYASNLAATVIFPPYSLNNLLGDCLQTADLKQLRLAETEKYAHVTFFFNGGRDQACKYEDRLLIPSPHVATYDLQPEMSAEALTDALIQAIEANSYDVIICNFANADMVGHTGDFHAACLAIEALDKSLARWIPVLLAAGGEALITADHGNAECMFDEESQQPHTAHTTEKVPCVYIGRKAVLQETGGTLADVAPTLLHLLGLNKPLEMTGHSLIQFL